MRFADHMITSLWLGLGLIVAYCTYQVVGSLVKFPFEKAGFDSRFPEKSWRYDAGKLLDLAHNSEASAYYRSPVLFPADLLVMFLLAGYMGAASYHWLGHLKSTWAWASLLFPLAYLLADIIEDGLLAWMLGNPERVKDHARTLRRITRIKLVGIIVSAAQTIILLLLYLIAVCGGDVT